MTDPTQTPEARAYRAGAEAMQQKCFEAAGAMKELAVKLRGQGSDATTAAHSVREIIRAIPLPDAPAREVSTRVKPLVWGPEPPYSVARIWGWHYATERHETGATLSGQPVGRKEFPSVIAAKAAAQADYERRILSALEEGPREVSVAEAAKVLLACKTVHAMTAAGKSLDLVQTLRALAGEAEHD